MHASESLLSFVTPFETGAHVIRAGFLEGKAFLALGDGRVGFLQDGQYVPFTVHAEGLLCADSDGAQLLTGGADGLVKRVDSDGTVFETGSTGGAWVDAVALKGDAAAWSAGRKVSVDDGKGGVFSYEAPSTARGLAFAPKGFQLAIAHYNGVSCWFPRTQGAPKAFVWKGSHLDVVFSPDGRFVVTSMQENALHGWRVADSANMRMSGYPSKTRSLSWSYDGQSLATSGAEAAIVWPFAAKDGPMGKAPQELGVRAARVSSVAFHPKAPVLAVGYADGCVIFVRIEDNKELWVTPPRDNGEAITSMAWSHDGMKLLFGAADGFAGLLTLPQL